VNGTSPAEIERSCSIAAVAFSDGRRQGARLVSGDHRSFTTTVARTVVHVPHPALASTWTRRSLTCGVALQCAPSKDRVALVSMDRLTPREGAALSIVEAGVALGWLAQSWPGLIPEVGRLLPDLRPGDPDMAADDMARRAVELAGANARIAVDPLLGTLPSTRSAGAVTAAVRRAFGRMPWTAKGRFSKGEYTIPVGGDGGVRNPNLPPPSRPENEDLDVRADQRLGIPYPEWNFWQQRFLPDHVAVLERRHPRAHGRPTSADPEVRRWFQQQTHRAMRGGLDDGSDLDVDRYVAHYLDGLGGRAPEGRFFRELVPSSRDVTTAVLLDGSSSLGAHQGRVFQLELACADALSLAMTAAGERHGVFVFTGNTRHRVEVTCLKDFPDRHVAVPSGVGLSTAGYTRLGAPLRHLTARLLDQPSERRLLLIVGDGMISDEGYEGRYAWADVGHAVEEAADAGVSVYYLGVGPARVDPLPEVFGVRRSQRIRHVEQLPRVLADVHHQLVAA
jgi:hypothetical protein